VKQRAGNFALLLGLRGCFSWTLRMQEVAAFDRAFIWVEVAVGGVVRTAGDMETEKRMKKRTEKTETDAEKMERGDRKR
jgi:hypothetical protein